MGGERERYMYIVYTCTCMYLHVVLVNYSLCIEVCFVSFGEGLRYAVDPVSKYISVPL